MILILNTFYSHVVFISEVQEVHQTTHLYDGLTSPVINASILYNGLNVSMRNDYFQNLSK